MTVYVDQPEVREGREDVPVSKHTYIGLYLSIAGMVVHNLRGVSTTDDNGLARSLIDLLLIPLIPTLQYKKIGLWRRF